jgi:hypothetical protein
MPDYRTLVHRLIAGAGLAAVVFGATAISAPSANADPIPQRGVPAAARPGATTTAPLSIEMQVSPGGTQANVYVRPTNSELIAVSHSVRRVNGGGTVAPPIRIPLDGIRAPITGGVATIDGVLSPADYRKEHTIRLTGLQSNTTYEVTVNAATPDGRTAVARQTFTTLKARVRVILEEITIEDDGDGIFRGDGEPRWEMDLTLGGKLCYPIKCGSFGNHGEGRFVPRDPAGNRLTWKLFEEVFNGLPDVLTMSVKAEEDDGAISGSPSQISTQTAVWRVPRGVETASSRVQVRGDQASRDFKSVLTFSFELFHDDTPYVIN